MNSHYLSPEPLSASGRSSGKMSLPTLQSKMKCDPVVSSDDEGFQITNSDNESEDDDMVSEDGDEIDENDNDVSGDEEENTQDEEEELVDDDATDGRRGSVAKDNMPKKRKFADDIDTQLNDAEAKDNSGTPAPSDWTDGILSNEDFRRIKQLKAKVRLAEQGLLKKNGDPNSIFKILTPEELQMKRVDPSKLEVHVKRKMSKEEKLRLAKEGREGRRKFMARAAVKQKKTGGLSNKQKEHEKAMPVVARRRKVARSRVEKRKKQRLSGKNFRGKKAWK